jgi:predicted RNase H-like HicB family nuclease
MAVLIVVEPDGERWHAYCPALMQQGGATWGHTQQEALKNIHEVIQMVVESMMEQGEAHGMNTDKKLRS